jgi:hypothetical protein
MPDDNPVAPQLIRQHISICERRWENQESRTRDLEKSMTETQLRLENGTHAFSDMRDEQASMSTTFAEKVASLTPKPPSVSKVTGIVLALISLAGGALWGLSTMISDRPTSGQIEKIIDGHQEHGHKDTRIEIRELHDVQIQQNTTIQSIEKKVDDQDVKLDTLIRQTAKTKSR